MKNNNKTIIIVIGVILLFLFIKGDFTKKEVAADASNAYISRTISPINPGPSETFTVTYNVLGVGSGSWGVLIEDDVDGGCSPSDVYLGWVGDSTPSSQTKTFTAPSSGSCSFSGISTYAGNSDAPIQGSNEITVDVPQCSLSTPELCTHIGPACVTHDGVAGRYLCNDAFQYDGFTYCEVTSLFDCVSAGYDSCLDDACLANIVCNAGYQLCSDGDNFNTYDMGGDAYECSSDGSEWNLHDNCLSSEICRELSYTNAECGLSCATLKSSAISKIISWSNSPTQYRKGLALQGIINWANNC